MYCMLLVEVPTFFSAATFQWDSAYSGESIDVSVYLDKVLNADPGEDCTFYIESDQDMQVSTTYVLYSQYNPGSTCLELVSQCQILDMWLVELPRHGQRSKSSYFNVR